MAASTKYRAESFGHYLLPLTMNKGHIDAKQAEYHIEVKTKYLDLKKHRPERHALRNLLGMLHFRLGKFEESLAFFDKILSDGEDPENLNALANRRYICDSLYIFPESRDCKEKISKLLPDNYQNEGEESRLRRARSLAEQAFVYSFDVFDESVTAERYRTSVELYEEAFGLAGDSLTQDEREDWMISNGMACHKIFNNIRWDKSLRKEATTWLEKSVNIFIQIVENTNDNSLASESWRQLGDIFNQAKPPYFIPIPDRYKRYVIKPIECFERALEYTPNDPRILARFAHFFIKIRNTEEAMKKVNQSIELDETVFNKFAFSVRGQIFLQDYKKELTACTKRSSSSRPDDSLLTKAQNNFEKAFKFHSTPFDLEVLAQVYYYMATNCHGNVKAGSDGQKYLQKALIVCARAAACQDGEKRPLVHKIRGQSLCALGEHQQALRSFQRAIECTQFKNVIFESGDLLFAEYGHVLKDIGDTLSSHQPLLADMVYWLHKAAELRLSNHQWTTYSMTALVNLTSQWRSFVEFCKNNDHIMELEDIQEASRKQPRAFDMCPLQSVTEEASGTRFDLEYASEAMNLRTGKTQLSDQTSSSQEWTSKDASNKPIRSAPEKAFNRDLTYDFFVIHSSSASEWVFRCLLEELEGRGLKGCIKDRDFTIGETIVNNYTGSTANSACVVIVITEDFEQDCWCDRGMLMAFGKRKLLIPVLREVTELPALLNPITHLDATGAVDWMRLQRSIEQQIRLHDA